MAWTLLLYTLQLFQILILARVVLSWVVSPYSRNPWVELVRRTTDPILNPVRSVLPDLGPIDISPIVAIMLLGLLQKLIVMIFA
jgi:YggT family protein